MTILMLDLNAKLGSDNNEYEEVMGRQVLSKMNQNGDMLAGVCAFNNMIIGGSIFPYRRIHEATWVAPDNRTENQIENTCIVRKFRRSTQDVKVQREADRASDHQLVLARTKMTLKKRDVQRNIRTQYNVDFMKDRVTTETFRLRVRNKYDDTSGRKKHGHRHTMATDQGGVDQHMQRKVQITIAEREQQRQQHRKSIHT